MSEKRMILDKEINDLLKKMILDEKINGPWRDQSSYRSKNSISKYIDKQQLVKDNSASDAICQFKGFMRQVFSHYEASV